MNTYLQFFNLTFFSTTNFHYLHRKLPRPCSSGSMLGWHAGWLGFKPGRGWNFSSLDFGCRGTLKLRASWGQYDQFLLCEQRPVAELRDMLLDDEKNKSNIFLFFIFKILKRSMKRKYLWGSSFRSFEAIDIFNANLLQRKNIQKGIKNAAN